MWNIINLNLIFQKYKSIITKFITFRRKTIASNYLKFSLFNVKFICFYANDFLYFADYFLLVTIWLVS